MDKIDSGLSPSLVERRSPGMMILLGGLLNHELINGNGYLRDYHSITGHGHRLECGFKNCNS